MDKLKKKWAKLSSSLAFRLSVYYSLSGLVVILFVLGFIYLQIMGALYGNNYRQINSVSKRITTIYEARGPLAVMSYLDQELNSYAPNSLELLYMQDKKGAKILGNIDAVPSEFFFGDYLIELGVYQKGKYIDARLKRLELGDVVVYVGRNLEEIIQIRSLMGRISLVTIFLALFLSGLSTYWFLFELRSGASSIRKTAEQIRAGRFKQRIPVRGQEDEIALLSKELNLMLDHMESAINGVRYVSDTIAHNLRTPLLRILAILRPLNQPELDVNEAGKGINQALIELEKLTVLFDKLLYISEIESGVQRQVVKKMHLNELLLNLVDLYEVLAEDQGIQLLIESKQDFFILADTDLVASALSNLLENALKYTKDLVIVRLYAVEGFVCIEVQDNGIGVKPSSLEHLGQHFYRDARAESVPGTGLGLSSVLAIMKLHQGYYSFENVNPGFLVCLWFPTLDEK